MSQAKVEKSLDFTVSIWVEKSPQETFAAINDVRGWWKGDIAGETDRVESEFTYTYKDFHQTTQKVIELIPNQKITWLVTKSKIGFVPNKNEWENTKIIFELKPEGKGTRIVFTHVGLTPAIECYEGCSGGWGFYIEKSLPNFILTGKGIAPNF